MISFQKELIPSGEQNSPLISEVAAAVSALPRAFAEQNGLAPQSCSHGRLRVLASTESSLEALDALGCITGFEIYSTPASANEVKAAIAERYAPNAHPASTTGSGANDLVDGADATGVSGTSEQNDQGNDSSDAPIVALVHQIIAEAVRRRASDIHVEPQEKKVRVRYRIDGVLLEAESQPKAQQPAIISRLKIMADISIAERRVPQDGRMRFSVPGEEAVDLRVSVVPSLHGETVVMRLLRREKLRPGLAELGLFDDDRMEFERLLTSPDGIVLVTGPTGSGKTTTLYSCLHHLNQPNRKIITVEDPIEYQLNGVNQVPVRQEIGMTFAAALRAMLRQSPNVVMVGEIRDGETAGIALQASLTGHLVFSTLHTNDAVGAITRLLDLGAKSFLVATSLRGVLAQRLVRKICSRCSQPYEPSPEQLRAVGWANLDLASANFAKGAGCADCNQTGYSGRIAICELLIIDAEMRSLIHGGAGTSQLRSRSRELGMRTMRADGLRKVTAGLTTIEEIVSITVADTP